MPLRHLFLGRASSAKHRRGEGFDPLPRHRPDHNDCSDWLDRVVQVRGNTCAHIAGCRSAAASWRRAPRYQIGSVPRGIRLVGLRGQRHRRGAGWHRRYRKLKAIKIVMEHLNGRPAQGDGSPAPRRRRDISWVSTVVRRRLYRSGRKIVKTSKEVKRQMWRMAAPLTSNRPAVFSGTRSPDRQTKRPKRD